MKKRILTEASGSLVSAYLIKAIKESGNVSIASDINKNNHGFSLADDFIEMPSSDDPNLWSKIEKKLIKSEVDIVIPSFDETLMGWSERKEYFYKKGINILISHPDSLEIYLDKYKAYKFCKLHEIPTPKTSISQKYKIVKPRFGRGGSGIYIGNEGQDMNNMISQEYIKGIEYTVDCLFDKNGEPIYIIPRQRIDIKDGKSTKGIVKKHNKIEKLVKKMSKEAVLVGPINFQFIETDDHLLYFLEVNPRIAGGMALGMAASENWINPIIDNFINNIQIRPKPIKYNLKMYRYYAESFV
ncbi:ATP-grasp domain-containing protein [Gammaproteobacteria bacterium]|nr:ATP-grasp domain-containing protein [Gammaproteobacteria bacterium]